MAITSDKKSFETSTVWKVVLTILVVLLSIFFIFGLIGRLIQVILKNQQKYVDKMMSKLIITRVITNEKDFKRIAKYKSRVYFFKHSIIPILILIITLTMWLTSMSLSSWERGMFSLFGQMIYPWEGWLTYFPPLGFQAPSVAHYVDMSNWFSIMTLITLGFFFVGIIYYFYEVGGFLARSYRIHKLSNKMFSKDLDDVDLSTFLNTNNTTLFSNNEQKTGAQAPVNNSLVQQQQLPNKVQ